MLAGALLLNFLAGKSMHQPSLTRNPIFVSFGVPPCLPGTLPRPLHSSLHMSDSAASPDDQEETLLWVHLKVNPGVDVSDALSSVSNFCHSFPFAAVLPVQPLQYLPLDDTGVEVKFLRKKTDIKSGVDGGIRFYVATSQETKANDSSSEESSLENEEEDEQESMLDEAEEEAEGPIIEIKAKRNSMGQVISKLMSEKLIVMKFVAELQEQELTAASDRDAAMSLQEAVALTSIYHKWM